MADERLTETKQITLRLTPELHKALRRTVLEQDTSIQEVGVDLFGKYVAHFNKEKA